ncbi:MAG: hypothetical protein A2289_16595 [Deltaproteobacteria bacterium RIFOXYA12_FULL_58_15]|nr:MAG: hypothetical protein A2289_16595 [Deltaproteobacteria bacterium RIFOXYA12_FULL_58_15]OGR10941.1 MAG: hypothetical protein A2341_11290 [Deltaproteobacteria bacterium RIFOXYB12_FULL_58_9]
MKMQMRKLTQLLLPTMVTFASAPVWAQSDVEAALKAVEEAEAVSAPAPVQPVEPAAEPQEVAEEADESIYVVQRRVFSKSGKFEVTPIFYTSLNNKFVGHLGLAVAAAYHLRENFAIEVQSSIPLAMYQFYSALVFEVYDHVEPPLTPQDVDLKQMDYFGALSAQFSALYGKMEFYGILIDYDLYATAGFGLVSTLETCSPPDTDDTTACGENLGFGKGLQSPEAGDRFKLSGNLGAGMRFFFSDHLGVRVELRDVVYSDKAVSTDTTTDIRNNVLFFAGLTILL